MGRAGLRSSTKIAQPIYHELISAFYALSGVPMVVDTSFNRRGEAIVNTPTEAIASFVALGADALAIGPFIAEHPSRVSPEPAGDLDIGVLAALERSKDALPPEAEHPCSLGCQSCPVSDAGGETATWATLKVNSLRARGWIPSLTLVVNDADLPSSALVAGVKEAKHMGYSEITLRTHGQRLHEPTSIACSRRGQSHRACAPRYLSQTP